MIRNFNGLTPRIHDTVFISETCYIVGDVEIGQNSSVWPGVVIRGDYGKITIGKNSAIQDNCVIHTDDYLNIGNNVSIGHGAVIHGHQIGNNVLIGINAVILDSAEIGNFCLIAAGAVVKQNAKIPDGSLVIGVPGIVRTLTERNRKSLEAPTANYIVNAQKFREHGYGIDVGSR